MRRTALALPKSVAPPPLGALALCLLTWLLVACGKQDGALPQSAPTAAAQGADDEAPTAAGDVTERLRAGFQRKAAEGEFWIGRWAIDLDALRAQEPFHALEDDAWRETRGMLDDLVFDFDPEGAASVALGGQVRAGTWSASRASGGASGAALLKTRMGDGEAALEEVFGVQLKGEQLLLERRAGGRAERLPLKRLR